MVKPRFPGHVEAPSATRRATDKWAHDTMRPEQLDSGSTHTAQPQEGCALLHPLQGVSLLSTPLQGGILKPPALRVVVDLLISPVMERMTWRSSMQCARDVVREKGTVAKEGELSQA